MFAYKVISNGNNIYTVKAYDCNNPSVLVNININLNQGSCTVGSYNGTVYGIKYTCDFSIYRDFLDFDGIHNDKNVSFIDNLPPINSITSDSPATIRVHKYDDYEIESEDIGGFTVTNGIASGDLEILNQDCFVGASSTSYCTDEYEVGISNCYNLYYDDYKEDCLFEIYHDEYNVIVNSENTSRILVTTSGTSNFVRSTTIDATANSSFDILYEIHDDYYDYVKIEGVTTGTAQLIYTDNEVSLSGIADDITITYIDYETFAETTVTIPYTGSSLTVTYP